ncbi:hypothetical protein Daesc_009633 [Daldinia eschscholtzii]|uniref:SprT-like domain-containing protein n=1 Tax=Daldinia eschscholtzii TaxID=292717 RepID=A0AAX6MA74_9PEZI
MASWYVGGTEMSRSSSDSSLLGGPYRQHRQHFEHKKRRPSYSEIDSLPDDLKVFQPFKRHRFVDNPDTFETMDFEQTLARPAFFIIKEGNSGFGSPRLGQTMVENPVTVPRRTEATVWPDSFQHFRVQSDSSIMSRPTFADRAHDEAAMRVAADLESSRRRSRVSQHERILRSLICPKSPEAEFDIDDVALQGIFYAANEIFFHGKLKGRVTWTWRDLPSYIIGTTALRWSPRANGYETLIYLSRHILKDRKYNRRLLISTFIHELIHSYLFVYCGFQSKECGGHTKGFQRIAKLINEWAGPELLYLDKMEAVLSNFETKASILPEGPNFDSWGTPCLHDLKDEDYIFPKQHQCRLWPADLRLLGRDFP